MAINENKRREAVLLCADFIAGVITIGAFEEKLQLLSANMDFPYDNLIAHALSVRASIRELFTEAALS